MFLVDARGAFQQAAVQVEYVPRVRLAAGGAAQNQGNLAVGHGMLGKVVINDKGVFPLVHKVFPHRTAGVGRQVQHGGRIGGGSRHDDGIFHGSRFLQFRHQAADVGALLADSHVNIVERLVIRKLAFLRQTVLFRLGNHGIHGNGGLPGGTVPDDEFALAAADGNHGVNGTETDWREMMPEAIFSTG